MTSRERVFAAARRQPLDCLPATPYNANFCATAAGFDISECQRDGKKLAQAQIRAWEMTGQDVVIAQSEQYYIAEGMGVKTRFEPHSLPIVTDVPIKRLEDIDALQPVNPYKDGRMYVYIEAVGRLREHFGDEVAVRASGIGAFALAGHLMGVDRFITELALCEADEDERAQDYLMRMLEVCCESHCRYAQACMEAGADIVQSGDSLASLDMISPAIYEKYAWPFERRFFERMAALKTERGLLTLLHICGDNTRVAPLLADTGCDILEVDYKVDLAAYKRDLGGRVCLMGNMNPAGALFSGTPDEVEAEARECIARAAAGGGFFLGSGCEVAAHAPVENVRRMVEVAHRR